MQAVVQEVETLSIGTANPGQSAPPPAVIGVIIHRVPESLIISEKYSRVQVGRSKRWPCVLVDEDNNVIPSQSAGVSFFVPKAEHWDFVHQHFPGACFVSDPTDPVPEGITVDRTGFVNLWLARNEPQQQLGLHVSVRATRNMSLSEFEDKLSLVHRTLCSGSAAGEGQQAVQRDLAEPGYPMDEAVAYGCGALEDVYKDPATHPNRALRAWAYHHHLAACDMTLDQLRKEPLPLLELLAEAVDAQPQQDDPWVCSRLNGLLEVLAAVLNYPPEYFSPFIPEAMTDCEEPE
jgi:hypothetical protein